MTGVQMCNSHNKGVQMHEVTQLNGNLKVTMKFLQCTNLYRR